MRSLQIIMIMLVYLLLTSCVAKQNLAGLWQIEKVKMGTEEMTPIARWTRLNTDQSQESGNGWVQHSIGTWEYDKVSKEIEIMNSNGVLDEFGGFTINNLDKETMHWSREEDGEKIDVFLKRIDKVPQSPANSLLGMWALLTESEVDEISYLFFRWDQILIDRESGMKKKYSIYKTHGHKQELQIVYYGDPLQQKNWNYSFENNDTLILESQNGNSKIVQKYKRIHYFPK